MTKLHKNNQFPVKTIGNTPFHNRPVTCGSDELFSSSLDHDVPDIVLGTNAI